MREQTSSKEVTMKPPKPRPGPYVCMALLCEKVLNEQDGVLSVIRVIDRITVSRRARGAHAPVCQPSDFGEIAR